jgi:single-strand DNA-binding protein
MMGIEGFIAREPEDRVTQTGKALKKFTVFISEGRDEQRQSAPVDVTLWEKEAESFDGHKGDRVLVQGRPKPEEWDDKETGKKRYKVGLTGELAVVRWRKPTDDTPAPAKQDAVNEDDLPF